MEEFGWPSGDERIPIQYRFLSLYKFLEVRYRGDNGHWNFKDLQQICQAQLPGYDDLGIPRTFQAELKRLRDRCAHIRTGNGKRRQFGVTALNPEALTEVTRFMPLLREICRAVFNSEMDGKVTFNDLRSWGERLSSGEAESSTKDVPPGLNLNEPATEAPIE